MLGLVATPADLGVKRHDSTILWRPALIWFVPTGRELTSDHSVHLASSRNSIELVVAHPKKNIVPLRRFCSPQKAVSSKDVQRQEKHHLVNLNNSSDVGRGRSQVSLRTETSASETTQDT